MTQEPPPLRLDPSHPLVTLKHAIERFAWLQTTIGLVGNLSFFVGSVLFLWESTKLVGTWLFIAGSLGMLLGSLGSAVLRIDEKINGRGSDTDDASEDRGRDSGVEHDTAADRSAAHA